MRFANHFEPADLRTLIIDAERVRLEAMSAQYTEVIFRHFTPEITKYMMPAPPTAIAQTEAFVAFAISGLERGDDLHFAICHKQQDEFIGVCGLHGRGHPTEPELGIWIKKPAHGNGYGLEAIRALKAWADRNIEFDRLRYPVDRRNIPSRRIPESLGGRIIEERKVMSLGGIGTR